MPYYVPKPGYEWNPLRRYPNVVCPCGSKKKAKRCHGALNLLPLDDIAKVKAYLCRLSAHGVIEARASHITHTAPEKAAPA